MTAFTKETLINDGMWVFYAPEGHMTPNAGRVFVARFKHARDGAGSFCAFLIKNVSVEHYFTEIAKGKPPLAIVEPMGYLLPHMKRMLKNAGYTADRAGFQKYLADWQRARSV